MLAPTPPGRLSSAQHVSVIQAELFLLNCLHGMESMLTGVHYWLLGKSNRVPLEVLEQDLGG